MQHYWTPNVPFLLPTYGGVPFCPHQCCVSDHKIVRTQGFLFGLRAMVQKQDPPAGLYRFKTHPSAMTTFAPLPASCSDKVRRRQSAVFVNFADFSFTKPNLYWFFLQRHLTCCTHRDQSLWITISI